jgi:Domain of unknown function (DUF2019)
MKRAKLQDMTVTSSWSVSPPSGSNKTINFSGGGTQKFKRLFDEMVATEDELKALDGDQRRELLSLYNHPNAQVRLNAIKATSAVAPEPA